MNPSITVTIDHQILSIQAGQTILEAADKAGIYIPRLCSYKGLPPFGACRLCIVEVDGMRGFPTSCSTPVSNGMVISTNTSSLQKLRANVLDLILSEHPSNCILCEETKECSLYMATIRKGEAVTGCRSCPEDGNCELQQAIQYIGVNNLSLPNLYKGKPIEKYDPFYNRDYNLCILCGRCVQVCHSIRLADVISFNLRGRDTFIGTAFNRTHIEAGCEFCGDCVTVCPTGSLIEKTRRYSAPIEVEYDTLCPFCSMGCNIILQTSKTQVIGSLPGYAQDGARVELCTLGRFGVFETVNQRTRAKYPLLTCGNHQKSISWEESLTIIVERLKSTQPNEYLMLISPDCTTEDLLYAQKFSREVMHSDQVYALSHTNYSYLIGLPNTLRFSPSGFMTLSKKDIILCLGVDQRYIQSNISLEIKKAARRGAQVILLQPGETNLDRYATKILPVNNDHIQFVLRYFADLVSTEELDSKVSSGVMIYQDLEHIKSMITEAEQVVVVIGDQYLENQTNWLLSNWIRNLSQNIDIRYLLIPQSANLETAYRLGLARFSYPKQDGLKPLKFAYLIGIQPPNHLKLADFIVYQNFVLPQKSSIVDMILPAPAFTEEEGTFMSFDGSIHHLKPVMKPFYQSSPTWKTLSRIAQALGVKDFNLEPENISDLLRQCSDQSPCTQNINNSDYQYLQFDSTNQMIEMNLQKPIFRGFSIQEWVKGLQDLPPLKIYFPNR